MENKDKVKKFIAVWVVWVTLVSVVFCIGLATAGYYFDGFIDWDTLFLLTLAVLLITLFAYPVIKFLIWSFKTALGEKE